MAQKWHKTLVEYIETYMKTWIHENIEYSQNFPASDVIRQGEFWVLTSYYVHEKDNRGGHIEFTLFSVF